MKKGLLAFAGLAAAGGGLFFFMRKRKLAKNSTVAFETPSNDPEKPPKHLRTTPRHLRNTSKRPGTSLNISKTLPNDPNTPLPFAHRMAAER